MAEYGYIEYEDESIECIDPEEFDAYIDSLRKKLKKLAEKGLLKAGKVQVTIPICGQTPFSTINVKATIDIER